MTCPHDFKRRWLCEHVIPCLGRCSKGRFIYRCKVCGEPGFALLDGVKPGTRPAVSLTGSRGEE